MSQCPVIHAQTVGEDEGLEGVGHDVFFGQEVVAEELLHPAVVVFLDLAEVTGAIGTLQLLFSLSVPEKGEFSHLLHGDVFTRLASKHGVILQGLEYEFLQQKKMKKLYSINMYRNSHWQTGAKYQPIKYLFEFRKVTFMAQISSPSKKRSISFQLKEAFFL